jgi:predicted oxidoreductase (fatty acid repression mutant protein)
LTDAKKKSIKKLILLFGEKDKMWIICEIDFKKAISSNEWEDIAKEIKMEANGVTMEDVLKEKKIQETDTDY